MEFVRLHSDFFCPFARAGVTRKQGPCLPLLSPALKGLEQCLAQSWCPVTPTLEEGRRKGRKEEENKEKEGGKREKMTLKSMDPQRCHTEGQGVRQTPWQADRQGEGPWLGRKAELPRWPSSSSQS